MIRGLAALLALLVASASSDASMSDRVVPGTVTDSRISRCGVVVTLGSFAEVRPFIEASSSVVGTVRLTLIKRSASGTSHTSQSRGFSGNRFDGSRTVVDIPADLSVRMEALDDTGLLLCRLEADLTLRRRPASA